MIIIPLLWFVPAMRLGGGAYTREVIVKQTVGRAVASWVHNAPPWFYVVHMPATLFPWLFLAVVAIAALWRTRRFLINWILAVLVPYSVMSSKLDVYMMALIPPVALLIAEAVPLGGRRVRIANQIANGILAVAAIAALFVRRPELALPNVKAFLIFTAVVAAIAFVIATRAEAVVGTLATGLVPVAEMVFAAIVLMPLVNGMTSTRPLVAALVRQHVPPERIALYTTPYLWTRDMPRELERVRYVDATNVAAAQPLVIATSRAHARELPLLAQYHLVDSVQMIGKPFDVYRR